MSIDFELLDGAIEDAATRAGGVHHEQGTYITVLDPDADTAEACGTACCLAGFIALRVGIKPPPLTRTPYDGWEYDDWYVDGVHVATIAAERAGLDIEQQEALFAGGNTLDDLRAMVAHLREHPRADMAELFELTERRRREPRDRAS